MIAIRIPAQPAGSRYKRKTKKGSQEAEANKDQQEILHGDIDQAVNVNQVSDAVGDEKIKKSLKHNKPPMTHLCVNIIMAQISAIVNTFMCHLIPYKRVMN